MSLAAYVLGRDCDRDCAARVYFKLVLCEFGAPPVLCHCVRVLPWGTIRAGQMRQTAIQIDKLVFIWTGTKMALTVVNLHNAISVIN